MSEEQPDGTDFRAGGAGGPIALGVLVLAIGALLALWLRPRTAPAPQAADAQSPATAPAAPGGMEAPHVMAASPEAAGRYLVLVGGCNDCHTPGFMEKGMQVPEAEWLTGVPVGWRGPWGTSYAANLRLSTQMLNEEMWVQVMSTRKVHAPMPWVSLNQMTPQDLHAVYRYIKSLGAAGERMPGFVPPGQEPKTPYLLMEPIRAKGE